MSSPDQELGRLIGEWQLKLNFSAVRAQRTQGGRNTHTQTQMWVLTHAHTSMEKRAHTDTCISMNNYWIIAVTKTHPFSQCHSLFWFSLKCTRTHTHTNSHPHKSLLSNLLPKLSLHCGSLFLPLQSELHLASLNKTQSLRKAFMKLLPVRWDFNGGEWKWQQEAEKQQLHTFFTTDIEMIW